MTQNEKIVNFLRTNGSLTPTTARKKLGVRNLRARINELRSNGVCVFTSRTNTGTSYTLGAPTPAIVATAYNAVGSSIFTATSSK